MTPFSFKIGDMECRSCGKQLLLDEPHDRAEIIRWYNSRNPEGVFCYVLANWEPKKEGFDLLFCGSRPFEVDRDIFWKLAEWGQERLEEDVRDETVAH